MNGQKILIVEDEVRMRMLISDYLKREGFEILEAGDGQQALDIFEQNDLDLVVLDIMLPKYDGWTVCRNIRKSSNVPIVMLTARSEESDELFGFELGVDEYITKPFSLKILVARIKALLSRTSPLSNDEISIGAIVIDTSAHIVSVNGQIAELTPKEYELLIYLVKNKGIALSREQILDGVWGYDYYGDLRTVDTHIKRLRMKIGESAVLIQTVRGIGYRFGGQI
ncbi:DNA-binding response regulator, OmpR family, contains REC and winged-helix (wHTH) domain [Peptoclostridium litorale DSM 5388]|uniref:Stage 0 sporulation protein A homolog n=1 Tax=Peptoclostridium litorale DSM 5388 TaxID=1121324 RepID=A0A069RPY5_PEPLI|nr:response regulator transcription factor [Peptoclostridium litorale]KDR96242.1 transcriptional regulatory protein SrrA [Peptoclostridium litorale DSM 5388]SIO14308.1 DNA-binding response regulator, OmpR family, contains REC and winged-helix (wHTH) domain [Peptoclostridium litorale DSM 5388]